MATAATSRTWSDGQFYSSFREIDNNPLEEGATTLMYACQQENIDQLLLILREKPEAAVRERDRTLKTVLHYCAENATLSCAEIILSAAPDIIDAADEDGYTTLHLAVIAGNNPLVNFLISKSADVNKLDVERHSVIHWATVCGEVELLQILLKFGAQPSTPDVHGGYPIHYAAQMCGATSEIGNDSKLGLAVLRVLLNHRVDVNVVDHDGRQPLLWAASAGSSEAVLSLINAGASVQTHDKDGLTALHCAASRGHTDCLETLINLCAADVDVMDNNGCSALFYSVTLGHADATQLLLKCGANPNRQDRKGRTPAHCGAAKGQFETLRILKKNNGDLWIRNVKGDYCLHEAVNCGRKDLVKWLLRKRPDAVNASNAEGRCPLHIAALTNNIELCKILLDYQSVVNPVMKTSKGDLMTPLDAALHKSNRGCAKYLQLHGGVPATKLNSYSAALRGPHRVESHSDYQGSPDGKLEAPVQTRGTRSLDTSPSGYQSSRRKKVEVRIRANVSSERVEKTSVFSDVKEYSSYRKCRRRKNVPDYDGNPPRKRSTSSRIPEDDNFSSDFSSSEDTSNSTTETDRRTRRRRRRDRRHRDDSRADKKRRTRSKAGRYLRSRSRCRRSDDDEDDRRLTARETKNDLIVESDGKKQCGKESRGDKARAARKTTQNVGVHHTVTVMVHREDEKDPAESRKPSESSENGIQEIQYRKLDAEIITDTDADAVRDAAGAVEKENEVKPDREKRTEKDVGVTDAFGEQPFVPPEQARREIGKKSDVDNGDVAVTDSNDIAVMETRQRAADIAADGREKRSTENIRPADDGDGKSTRSGDDRIEIKAGTDFNKASESNEPATEHREETSGDGGSRDENSKEAEKRASVRSGKETSKDTTAEITTPTDASKPETRENEVKDGDDAINIEAGENIRRPIDESKDPKTERNFDNDKGLICVILDENETLEMERAKDAAARLKNTYQSEAAGTNRKKEKNTQKRQRRSRSSFEILSDGRNNESSSSRLTVHDDSGFEPSPRHSESTLEDAPVKNKTRIPRATSHNQPGKQYENDPNINVSSVTQAVQNSLRKYHLERRIFHTLLELKKLQIRVGKSNEQVLVKRLVDDYQKAGVIVGIRTYDGVYSFRHFERYLYEQLRVLQSANRKDIPRIKSSDDFERLTKALKRTKAGKTLLENVPDNPLFCTHGTHRCIHATHAYTGIPCAAYITKLDHHKLPKTTDSYRCFLPRIDNRYEQRKNAGNGEVAKSLKHVDPSKPVTLELVHGAEKQIISLPTEKLDKNKRYFVTFTIKNNSDVSSSDCEKNQSPSSNIGETDCS